MRFWGTRWMGLPPDEALDFFDKSGVVVRRSGMLDGEAIGYMAIENDPALKKQYGSEIKMELMENWRDQMIAQVKGERNHPSIMIWSIENEWLYINCINLYGQLDGPVRGRGGQGSRTRCEAIDPTRPVMTDGGGATKSNRMPVHGDHYTAGPFSEYPTLAYEPNTKGGGRGRWEWDLKRPRFIGEELFAAGHNPAYAYFGGEEVFVGQQSARAAVGIAVRMMTEGAAGTATGRSISGRPRRRRPASMLANAPRAVFCRQWDWTFGTSQTVRPHLSASSTTRTMTSPITFTRSVKFGDHEVAAQDPSTAYPPAAAWYLHDPLTLTLPAASRTHRGEGRAGPVAAHAGAGKSFETSKMSRYLNLGAEAARARQLAASGLAVYDPAGDVGRFLQDASDQIHGAQRI